MSAADPSRWQVLLVENDSDLRETVAEVLESAGFSVRAFHSPLEALRVLLRGYKPAVVLLDHVMEEMNGLDFRREMLLNTETAEIPAILFSGDRVNERELEPLRLQLLRKPSGISELLTVVGELVGRRQSPR